MEKETLVKVRNRAEGSVGYIIPDLGNLNRQFMANETKEVPFDELRKLSFVPGGRYLLDNCLIIEDKTALQELVGDVEPEYFYTEEDIRNLLLVGSMDSFLDFLDFAPQGGIDLAKDLAVKLQINDINKREAIKSKTGFDVTKAIEFNKETADDAPQEEKVRRTAPVTPSAEATGRRTTPPKYKVTVTQ